ncbi:hypothetical protein Aau02nite_89030 [Amorphoplanes auranticolor]|uniref:Helix-turn-helix protein n=1 Tax=Actinoplanes auranticolor TaxID=47988 RepID=A0A919VY74_9ACTN|nr:hypothetical protein Aau02nite_89030 [Actinoplanes auranticolor]
MIGGAAALVFLVATVLFVVLKVTEGDTSRADQLASVISMIIGAASLLVAVVSGIASLRSSSPAEPRMTPEQIFAAELSDLIARSGKPTQRDLKAELAAYPGVASGAPKKLSDILKGTHRPDAVLAAAIVDICLRRARAASIGLPEPRQRPEYWTQRYDELFAAPPSGRRNYGLAAAGVVLVGVIVVPVAVVLLDDDGPRPEATPGAAASPAAFDGTDPITTSAVEVPDVCTGGYLITKPVADVGAIPEGRDPQDWVAWSAEQGMPTASRSRIQFTVRGRSNAAITLTRVRVTAIDRSVPLAAPWLHVGCGGERALRWFNADLDADPPRVTTDYDRDAANDDDPPERRTPIRFPYTVSLEDPESFEVSAYTVDCDCVWQIELDWNSGEHHGTHMVGDAGKPARFRTVGRSRATSECLNSLTSCTPMER